MQPLTYLALPLDSVVVVVSCICEAQVHDLGSILQLTATSISARYFLLNSENEAFRTSCQRGLGAVLPQHYDFTHLN